MDQIRVVTRDLHRLRGDWSKSSLDYRAWNETPPTRSDAARPPASLEAYNAHLKRAQMTPEQFLHSDAPAPRLTDGSDAPRSLDARIAAYRTHLLARFNLPADPV